LRMLTEYVRDGESSERSMRRKERQEAMTPVVRRNDTSHRSGQPKPDVITPDMTLQGLATSSHLSRTIDHPGQDIRPCVATLADTPLSKGEFPDRNTSAVVIASELKRVGKNYEFIADYLTRWNRFNHPPLTPTDLNRAVNNSYASEYNYSCTNAILQSFCVGEDMCPFASRVLSKRKAYRNFTFIDYGWQKHLTNLQVLVYMVALPGLEVKRRVGPGGLIHAGHREIADACGCTPRRLGTLLETLAAVGLVEYQPGTPRRWEVKASTVRRILPIPRPTREALIRVTKKAG